MSLFSFVVLSFAALNLGFSKEKPKFATGAIFTVLDKEVKSVDGKDLSKDPVRTVISLVGGDKDGRIVSVSKTLTDEKGVETPVVEEEIHLFDSREAALEKKPQGSFGFYLKDKKSFVVVSENHWGKSAVLYREREDQHLDSQTVTDWRILVDINPQSPQAPAGKKKTKSPKHTPLEVESGANE